MATTVAEAKEMLDQIIAGTNAEASAPAHAAPTLDITELLAVARTKLGVVKATPEQAVNEIVPTDPALVLELIARANELKRSSDAAVKERSKITDLLAELTGEGGELVVDGGAVFTVKTVVSRVLDATHIKSIFPDLPENAEMWKDQPAVRRDYR
jgi:hypothetical protein